MHRTEGPDHDGSNLHKETFPATVINKNIMNALQEEVVNAVLRSGQTLAASGAADETAGWLQLATAIADLNAAGEVKKIAAKLTAPSETSVDLDLHYIVHGLGKLTTIHFPDTNFVVSQATTNQIKLVQSDGTTPLPDNLKPLSVGSWFQKIVTDFGDGVSAAVIIYDNSVPFFGFVQESGSANNFPVATFDIHAFSMTFINRTATLEA